MYSVSTQQVSTQAVNEFIKILNLKGKNTGESTCQRQVDYNNNLITVQSCQ